MTIEESEQDSHVVNREWSDIPYFRKPFFLIMLILLFMPGYLLMAWTGDLYYRKNGLVHKTSLKQKQWITVVLILLMVSYLIRNLSKH